MAIHLRLLRYYLNVVVVVELVLVCAHLALVVVVLHLEQCNYCKIY